MTFPHGAPPQAACPLDLHGPLSLLHEHPHDLGLLLDMPPAEDQHKIERRTEGMHAWATLQQASCEDSGLLIRANSSRTKSATFRDTRDINRPSNDMRKPTSIACISCTAPEQIRSHCIARRPLSVRASYGFGQGRLVEPAVHGVQVLLTSPRVPGVRRGDGSRGLQSHVGPRLRPHFGAGSRSDYRYSRFQSVFPTRVTLSAGSTRGYAI